MSPLPPGTLSRGIKSILKSGSFILSPGAGNTETLTLHSGKLWGVSQTFWALLRTHSRELGVDFIRVEVI